MKQLDMFEELEKKKEKQRVMNNNAKLGYLRTDEDGSVWYQIYYDTPSSKYYGYSENTE